jgi:ABC-2 type transport system ATP-binding protein
MAANGKTIFITTHYMDEAEHCDRLDLINAGRIVASGTPSELKRKQSGRVLLEAAISQPIRAFAVVRKNFPEASPALFGTSLHLTVENRAEAETKLREVLGKAGVGIESITPIPFALEDVFCRVMEETAAA